MGSTSLAAAAQRIEQPGRSRAEKASGCAALEQSINSNGRFSPDRRPLARRLFVRVAAGDEAGNPALLHGPSAFETIRSYSHTAAASMPGWLAPCGAPPRPTATARSLRQRRRPEPVFAAKPVYNLIGPLELYDFVLDAEFLALQIVNRRLIGKRPVDFFIESAFERCVLFFECLDAIVLRHAVSSCDTPKADGSVGPIFGTAVSTVADSCFAKLCDVERIVLKGR